MSSIEGQDASKGGGCCAGGAQNFVLAAAPWLRHSGVQWALILLLLFVIGCLPRTAGILWDGVNNDENFQKSVKVLAGQWIPDTHRYPPLLNYLNAFSIAVMYVGGRFLGVWYSSDAFMLQWFQAPAPFFVACRLVTVVLGALTGPLTSAIARRLGASVRGAFFAGLLATLLPLNIYFSHISKSDVPMASAYLLLIWIFCVATQNPNRLRYTILLAVVAAVCVSFKQTGVFLCVPLLCAYLVFYAVRKDGGARPAIWHACVLGISGLIGWCILNAAILVDFDHFMKDQKVTAVMNNRSLDFGFIFTDLLPRACRLQDGPTWIALLLWVVAICLARSFAARAIWISHSISWVLVVLMFGGKFTASAMVGFCTPLVSCALALTLAASPTMAKPLRAGVALLVLFGLGWFSYGSSQIISEALTPGMHHELGRLIKANVDPQQDKILGVRTVSRAVSTSLQGHMDMHARDERLGEKYGTEIPPRHPMRLEALANQKNPQFYFFELPFAIGGLQHADDSDIEQMTAFAWNVQEEEWDLDYWLEQDFTVFVVEEEVYINSEVPAYKRLHEQIKERCEFLVVLDPIRLKFQKERQIKIYRYTPPAAAAP